MTSSPQQLAGALPPLRFTPWLRPMVWGRDRLGRILGKQLPSKDPYGESWEISDHPQHRSVIAAGPLAGTGLRFLMEHRREELLGQSAAHYKVFPWLIKFLDANDWLSLQVHPDDEAVKRLWPGEGGKTEAWFVLDARPGSRIYAGLRPGVDEPALRAALANGTAAECLHAFAPKAGDCLLLPAGTVHAVGGGVLLAEVQQTSDATFRLFDWNRRDAQGKSRPLHIEAGLAAIDWERGPLTPVKVSSFAASEVGHTTTHQPLVMTPYFQIDYRAGTVDFPLGEPGQLKALLILAGKGRLSWSGNEEHLHAGEVWLLPAALAPVRCVPESGLAVLVCSLP